MWRKPDKNDPDRESSRSEVKPTSLFSTLRRKPPNNHLNNESRKSRKSESSVEADFPNNNGSTEIANKSAESDVNFESEPSLISKINDINNADDRYGFSDLAEEDIKPFDLHQSSETSNINIIPIIETKPSTAGKSYRSRSSSVAIVQPQRTITPKIEQDKISEKTLDQTHKFIDRILFELDSKTTAIQLLGKDIIHLRESNILQIEEISILKKSLENSNLKTKRLISGFDLEALDPTELRRRYALLSNKLETTLDLQRRLEKEIDSLQIELDSKSRVEKELKQVRMAHVAQQALVLNLQQLPGIEKHQQVILKQEKVIKKLEAMIKSAKDHHVTKPESASEGEFNLIIDSKLYKCLIQENRDLKQRLNTLESIKSNAILNVGNDSPHDKVNA